MRLLPAPIGACWSKALLSAAIVVAIWGLCGSVVAQPRPDVALHGMADSVAAHERFTLTISASVPAHRAVQFPAADAGPSVFGDLTVLSRSPVRKQRVGAGYAISTVTYEVMTAASDSVRVPPLPVRVDAAVDTVVTSTLPRTLYVTSEPGSLTSRLREGPFPTPPRFPWTWIVLAGIAMTLLGGATYLWRDFRDASPSPVSASATDKTTTPHDVAMRRLRRLQSRDLTDPNVVESFYVALSDTVRTYLSARLDVAARERTTREVRTALDRRAEVPPPAAEHLHTVLEQADLVKFADARPDPSRAAEALRAARTAIEVIEDTVSAETSPVAETVPRSDASSR